MSSPTKDALKPPSRRQPKYSIPVKNKDSERDRRRDLFLKKVKQAGDDTRWEARGDQVRVCPDSEGLRLINMLDNSRS